MNSLSATTSLPAPSAKIFDFNAAALAAYKKRRAQGKDEVVRHDSPLVAAAKADPEVEVVDIDWLHEVTEMLSEARFGSLVAVPRIAAAGLPGGCTVDNALWAMWGMLKAAERGGYLEAYQRGEPI
ncbi:hypothetical protein D3C77_281770 [compost metagenome]